MIFNRLQGTVQPIDSVNKPLFGKNQLPLSFDVAKRTTPGGIVQIWDVNSSRLISTVIPSGRTTSFSQVGHSLLTLVLALIGGQLAYVWNGDLKPSTNDGSRARHNSEEPNRLP